MAFIKSCSIDSRNEQSPTCEVEHETKLTSEISCPTDSCLAQLSEHWSHDLEVLSSTVADPGFGQGGQEFFPRFCRHSEVKLGEQSEQYNISI